jgi:hypothetical protein
MFSCRKQEKKESILLADREAPLGWVYLRIYKDKTFEFESRGLERRGYIYEGTVELKNDTLYFNYLDSIPRVGKKAILNEKSILYFNGEYPESLLIKKNEFGTE